MMDPPWPWNPWAEKLKSETESTSGSTKWWLVTAKQFKKIVCYCRVEHIGKMREQNTGKIRGFCTIFIYFMFPVIWILDYFFFLCYFSMLVNWTVFKTKIEKVLENGKIREICRSDHVRTCKQCKGDLIEIYSEICIYSKRVPYLLYWEWWFIPKISINSHCKIVTFEFWVVIHETFQVIFQVRPTSNKNLSTCNSGGTK